MDVALSRGLRFGAAALMSLAVAACSAERSIAPSAAPLFDLGEDAGPDSGYHVVYASDGPGEMMMAAMAGEPNIRIGVIQSAATVALGSDAAFQIRDKATQELLFSGAPGTSATVSLVSAPDSWYRLQVMCGKDVAVVERERAEAEAAGYVTFTEYYAGGSCTRLYLGKFAPPPASTFGPRNTFRLAAIAAGFAPADAFWRVVTVNGNTVYGVAYAGVNKQAVNPIVVTSSSGIVRIGTATYRNRGEARMVTTTSMAGINELPIEQYLYGVVPRELGPVAYPEIAAQKAQAVAARTYALRGLGKRSSEGYDLYATTTDQVYGGYAAEHPVSTSAIHDTRGMVATRNGTLIDALFSSTSGGHTADSEEAYAGVVDYLRGIPDAERGQAMQHVPSLEVFRAHANPASLRAQKEGDFESDWSKYHRWSFEWTAAEIASVISVFAQRPVTQVYAINVLERGPSGRVTRIEYVTDAGTFTDTKDRIRTSLKYITASGAQASLLSTLFFIERVREGGEFTGGFRVYGGGWGHGVGLSQTGAVGMAEKGHGYQEILMHYYRGIAVEPWYP